MKVAVIGGIHNLSQAYQHSVEQMGHECLYYNGPTRHLEQRLVGVDVIALFTRNISHQVSRIIWNHARRRGVAIVCPQGSGLSSLRRSLRSLPGAGN